MQLEILKLPEPVKLCVICQRTPDDCDGKGPHIYDALTYGWAIVDMDAQQPLSFHTSHDDAHRGLNHYLA